MGALLAGGHMAPGDRPFLTTVAAEPCEFYRVVRLGQRDDIVGDRAAFRARLGHQPNESLWSRRHCDAPVDFTRPAHCDQFSRPL
jgi:hypothetical protein